MTVSKLIPDQPPTDDPAGGLFCFSDNDETFTGGETSRAAAFAAGCDLYPDADCIYVGEQIPLTHATFIDGDYIVDQMRESAGGEVGEAADDYLQEIGKEEIEELETMLAQWFERKAGVVSFYRVENVECMARDQGAQA